MGHISVEFLRMYIDTMKERCAAAIAAKDEQWMITSSVIVVLRATICIFHDHAKKSIFSDLLVQALGPPPFPAKTLATLACKSMLGFVQYHFNFACE